MGLGPYNWPKLTRKKSLSDVGVCDYKEIDNQRQTDGGQSDPFVPLCLAGNTKIVCGDLFFIVQLANIMQKIVKIINQTTQSVASLNTQNLSMTWTFDWWP